MKLNAVGVAAKDITKSLDFYRTLGFTFPENIDGKDHVDSIAEEGSIRLMLDSVEVIKDILGETPKPANHSHFALQYDTAAEIDEVIKQVESKGYTVIKQPWDALWGQRYAIVADPDGYMVDLYAQL